MFLNLNIVLQSVLAFLLSYASFVSIYVSLIKRKDLSLLTGFYILTLFSFAVFSIYQLFFFKQSPQKNLKPKKWHKNKKALALAFLCFFSFFAGFFNIKTQYSRGMFFDSANQFSRSLSQNPINRSAKEQQPPLDYYFSAFSAYMFGFSKFAVRFHAIFSYLLLACIISLIFYFFSSSLWISLIGSSLFLINHLIRLLSLYGRPLSLGLLTGSLFLFFYLSYCDKDRLKYKVSFFSVCSSQYLFIMSVGLQPVILALSLFLSAVLVLFKSKRNIFLSLFFLFKINKNINKHYQ
ncbi:MAG: hypothetical protein OXJ52_06530 [Oligoflexia bacterium]|nr:hypothetical protein [Oligoflexia bacterium]